MPRPQTAVYPNYELGPAIPNNLNLDTASNPGELKFKAKGIGASVEFHVEYPLPIGTTPTIPGTVPAAAANPPGNVQLTAEVSPDNVQWFPITDTAHGLVVGPLWPGGVEPVGSGSGSGASVIGTVNLTLYQIVPGGHIRGAFNLRGGENGPDKYVRFRNANARILIQLRTSALDIMRV